MVAEPITDTQWGIGNWTDFENNWREKDAEYLQSRVIPRFHGSSDRDSALTAPAVGQVVYNETTDRLEIRSKTAVWQKYDALPVNMKIAQDTTGVVQLSHLGATSVGVQFTPTEIKIPGTLNILNETVRITSGGILIGPDALPGGPAVITYDGTAVVGNKPFKVPSLILTGSGIVVDATGKEIKASTLTTTLLAAQNINMAGTLSGGTVNAAGGTIGGVKLGTPLANTADADAYTTKGARFAGDGAKGVLNFPAKIGSVSVDDRVGLAGDGIDLRADTSVRNRFIAWYDGTDVLKGYYAISVYSPTDPGAVNYPNGTIWMS